MELHTANVLCHLLCAGSHTSLSAFFSAQVSPPQKGLPWHPISITSISIPLPYTLFFLKYSSLITSILHICLLFLLLKCKLHSSRESCLFHVYLPHLEQCLAYKRPFISSPHSNTMIDLYFQVEETSTTEVPKKGGINSLVWVAKQQPWWLDHSEWEEGGSDTAFGPGLWVLQLTDIHLLSQKGICLESSGQREVYW